MRLGNRSQHHRPTGLGATVSSSPAPLSVTGITCAVTEGYQSRYAACQLRTRPVNTAYDSAVVVRLQRISSRSEWPAFAGESPGGSPVSAGCMAVGDNDEPGGTLNLPALKGGDSGGTTMVASRVVRPWE